MKTNIISILMMIFLLPIISFNQTRSALLSSDEEGGVRFAQYGREYLKAYYQNLAGTPTSKMTQRSGFLNNHLVFNKAIDLIELESINDPVIGKLNKDYIYPFLEKLAPVQNLILSSFVFVQNRVQYNPNFSPSQNQEYYQNLIIEALRHMGSNIPLESQRYFGSNYYYKFEAIAREILPPAAYQGENLLSFITTVYIKSLKQMVDQFFRLYGLSSEYPASILQGALQGPSIGTNIDSNIVKKQYLEKYRLVTEYSAVLNSRFYVAVSKGKPIEEIEQSIYVLNTFYDFLENPMNLSNKVYTMKVYYSPNYPAIEAVLDEVNNYAVFARTNKKFFDRVDISLYGLYMQTLLAIKDNIYQMYYLTY